MAHRSSTHSLECVRLFHSVLCNLRMSLAGLRRLSCTLIPSACGCKPGTALFCSPVSRVIQTSRKSVGTSQIGQLRALSAGHSPDKVEHDEPVEFKERVKVMWKKYGKLAIATYLGVYVTTLSSLFLALDFDLFNSASVGFDHAATIAKVCEIYEGITGSSTLPQYIKDHPTVGTLAVAWLMTKFTEPLRLATTVVIVPPIARYWNKLVANKAANEVHK